MIIEDILQTHLPKDLSEVEKSLSEITRERGFDYFSYAGGQAFNPRAGGHDIWSQPPTVLITFPTEWVRVYHQENLGSHDPVLSLTMELKLPFSWDVENVTTDVKEMHKAFFHKAHDFNVCQGLSIPVYGPTGDFALFTFISREDRRGFKKLVSAHQNELHLISIYYHQLIQKLNQTETKTIRLTDREKEVLYWTAAGKTGFEIGIILNIAEKTVQFHLYNSMRKLDVFSRPQAVSKAILLGLIQP